MGILLDKIAASPQVRNYIPRGAMQQIEADVCRISKGHYFK